MLLTITTTHRPATDLGFLLHKNPARLNSFELSFGKAHVFYPEATEERCTAALLLEVAPVELVRGRKGPPGEGGLLDQYVNDRPYVASSYMSVAIGQVFRNTMRGESKERPDTAQAKLPLEVRIAALACRGGEEFLRQLFEPLGYRVAAQGQALDEKFPGWGASRYFTVRLESVLRLSELLTHLYVLIPVLDDEKHYWVSDDEVQKLLRHGEGWLAAHPERERIAQRYLRHQRRLAREALARLVEEEQADPDADAEEQLGEEDQLEERLSLNEQRLGAVLAALRASGARRVLDLGCGEGRLLQRLLEDSQFQEITGVDVSYRALQKAAERLHLDRLAASRRERIRLQQGGLTYRDARIEGYEAAAVVEVIEHLDPPRLAAFERVVFECARPGTVVITTPNREYNVKWESLPAGSVRHRDHRFEWTRAEFQAWAQETSSRFGYTARFLPVGPEDAAVGAPTQMAVFSRSK